MNRRDMILGAVAAFVRPDRLVAHSYIFVQEAQRRKVRHVDEVERICGVIAAAGFRSVEFMSDFFARDVRDRTIAAVKKYGLKVPIVYAGEDKAAAVAAAAREVGLVAINTNPSPKPGRARKSDEELAAQATSLNRLGETLSKQGVKLLYHTHDPEMVEDAREWRQMLRQTDPKLVSFCIDTHWMFRGGQDPVKLIAEAGKRIHSLHVRNSRDKVWSDVFGPGDLDYMQIASAVKRAGVDPYVVVELAYEKGTPGQWDLAAALKQSHEYAAKVF